jgi:hypothetical protein
VAGDNQPGIVLPDEFDDTFPVGPEAGNGAFFGRNVLQGLVDGIDDFIHGRQPRWNRYRSLGPTLLGSAMWINDEVLIDKVGELAAACIVVTKQGRREQPKLAPLAELNRRTPGMPLHAFAELTELAPRVDGRSVVLGPSSPIYGGPIPTIRTLGFRKSKENQAPPIIHAKLVLLGHLWWHDEDDSPAGVTDVTGFQPFRLWISSANFTTSSRHSLEFGYWTEDPALLQAPSVSSSSSCARPKHSTLPLTTSNPTLCLSSTTTKRWLRRWAKWPGKSESRTDTGGRRPDRAIETPTSLSLLPTTVTPDRVALVGAARVERGRLPQRRRMGHPALQPG